MDGVDIIIIISNSKLYNSVMIKFLFPNDEMTNDVLVLLNCLARMRIHRVV